MAGAHLVDGVDGANSVGVQAHGSAALSGVTVKNIRVTDWAHGDLLLGCPRQNRGRDRVLEHQAGIMLYAGGDGTVITGCTAENNGVGGLSVSYAPGVEISLLHGTEQRQRRHLSLRVQRRPGHRCDVQRQHHERHRPRRDQHRPDNAAFSSRVPGDGQRESRHLHEPRRGQHGGQQPDREHQEHALRRDEIGANTWNTAEDGRHEHRRRRVPRRQLVVRVLERLPPTRIGTGSPTRLYAIGAGNTDSLPLVSHSAERLHNPAGMVITVPGTVLARPRISRTTAHPIVVEIRCSNVVIDGNGHRISGSGQERMVRDLCQHPAGAVTGLTIRDLTSRTATTASTCPTPIRSWIERCRIDRHPVERDGPDPLTRGATATRHRKQDPCRIVRGARHHGDHHQLVVAEHHHQQRVQQPGQRLHRRHASDRTPGTAPGQPARTSSAARTSAATTGPNRTAPGWSQQAADTNNDGIGDSPYALATGNTRCLPLVKPRPVARLHRDCRRSGPRRSRSSSRTPRPGRRPRGRGPLATARPRACGTRATPTPPSAPTPSR